MAFGCGVTDAIGKRGVDADGNTGDSASVLLVRRTVDSA